MSGSTRIDLTSDFYHLSAASPGTNFRFNPDNPGYETRWHQGWKEDAENWVERTRPILERRVVILAVLPDPEWPIVNYEERFPWPNPYRNPETPPPWRLGFVDMKGTGMTHVTVAFSRMPTEAARDRFKLELSKDFAMLDPKEEVI